ARAELPQERDAVQIHRDELGLIPRTPASHAHHEVKRFQRLNRTEQNGDEQKRHHLRQRDVPKLEPRARAVNCRRLIQIIGNRIQTGQDEQHDEWTPHPYVYEDDTGEREIGNRLVEQTTADDIQICRIDERNDVIEKTKIGIVDELPEQPDNDRR